MSIFLDRFKVCYEKYHFHTNEWTGRRLPASYKFAETTHEVKVLETIFHEETFKDHFQLIITEVRYSMREVLDANGNPFTSHYSVDESLVAGYGETKLVNVYTAYAWEIGTKYDNEPLNWLTHNSVVSGIGRGSSMVKTMKVAKDKLEILSRVRAIKGELIALAGEQYGGSWANAKPPYNAFVGDRVWVQAHGRLRRGVIVATTGSRFVVGYLTPSNHEELKYKTLAQSGLTGDWD
jgi:hypothetical protein